MVERDRLQESLGAEPGPAREQALQMSGTEARLIGQSFQGWLLSPVFRNESQRVFYQFIVVCLLFHGANLGRAIARSHPFLAQKCGFASAAFRAREKA